MMRNKHTWILSILSILVLSVLMPLRVSADLVCVPFVECGNGHVEDATFVIPGTEQCDAGANNGKVCTPPLIFGATCTYCRTNCKTATITQGSVCGDGLCTIAEQCSNCEVDCGECDDDSSTTSTGFSQD